MTSREKYILEQTTKKVVASTGEKKNEPAKTQGTNGKDSKKP